jgi:3',5'-cyclic AMP phosphodiesterase CpdA
MIDERDRREFLKLLGVGGVTFASGLWGCARGPAAGGAGAAAPPAAGGIEDFVFLQLTDTHWGYKGAANPEAEATLRQVVATINASAVAPDFIVFTGDLTHTTDDARLRRARLSEFRDIVAGLHVKDVRFLAGEHDAAPDGGEAYRELLGSPTHAFVHKGVHFIALDNVSLPGGALGDSQLAWLAKEVAKVPPAAPLVVLAHRPLFDLFPAWEWATPDGARALQILDRHPRVTVFYGHIHQEHHFTTGHIQHHAGRSLIFPLPAAGSVPKRAPLAWDAGSVDHGLGHRSIRIDGGEAVAAEVPYSPAKV